MRPNLDSVLFGESYGARHNARIRSVESARHIGDRYVRHNGFIITHLVEPEALTHVAVDAYQH
jgi:hydrogenase maturation factor